MELTQVALCVAGALSLFLVLGFVVKWMVIYWLIRLGLSTVTRA